MCVRLFIIGISVSRNNVVVSGMVVRKFSVLKLKVFVMFFRKNISNSEDSSMNLCCVFGMGFFVIVLWGWWGVRV